MTMNSDDQRELQKRLNELSKYIVNNFMKEGLRIPAPLETDEQRKLRKQAQEVQTLEDHHNRILQIAEIFASRDAEGKLIPIINKVQNAKLEDFANKQFMQASEFEALIITALAAYNDKDYETAMSMAAYISHIFPFEVQPYLIMATIIWKQEGVYKAADFYDKIIDVLHNPILYMYAADCFAAADKLDDARDALRLALQICNENTSFALLKKDIEAAMHELR